MAQTPFQCRGQYYLTKLFDSPGGDYSRIFNVRIVDRSGQIFFDPIPGNQNRLFVNAMGYRITDNLLYMIEDDNKDNFGLIRTGSDGVFHELRDLPELEGIVAYQAGACTPDGRYLVVARTPRGRTFVPGVGFFEESAFNDALFFIDLTDPAYPVRELALRNDRFIFADMAFDPFTGFLYAYDQAEQRLIQINIDDGTTTAVGAPDQPATVMGSMFFDAAGRLYGYGDHTETAALDQSTLFSINKSTGLVSPLVDSEPADASDGCSCPYTVDLLKSVTPGRALACQDVTYTFTVSNASAIARQGLTLTDTLAAGLRIKEIIDNPFGGSVNISDDGRIISIENMVVPLGLDSLSILVEIDQGVSGFLENQAVLAGLPDSLGAMILSDDPSTLAVDDPTVLTVPALEFDLELGNNMLCTGDTLILSVEDLNADYIWSDGTIGAQLPVTEPGLYGLMASSLCEDFSDQVQVEFHEPIEVEIISSASTMKLGDSVDLEAEISPMATYQLFWSINQDSLIGPCTNCNPINDQPFFSSIYHLSVQNTQTACAGFDSVRVNVDRTLGIWTPNVFTPNGDGVNEHFYIMGNCPYPVTTFEIFNRWGNRVYRIENIAVNDESTGWDGMAGGAIATPAVFIWKAIFERPDGTTATRTGDVTLLR